VLKPRPLDPESNKHTIKLPCPSFLLTKTCIIVLFLLIDLSDVHLDDDEKENISPDDLPAFVTIDTFGESFEEAVSISLSIFIICLSP